MKKFMKWFGIFLLLGGLLSYAICYMVMPDRTKDFTYIAIQWANTPLFIAGGTTITIGLVVGVILKLVYDRYREKINGDYQQAKEFSKSQYEKAQECYEKILQTKEQVVEMLESYSTHIEKLEEELIEVCETSPNAKVKALGEKIRTNSKIIKDDLKQKLEFVSAMEKHDTIVELENKIKELTEQVGKLVEEHEREETIND